METRSFIIRRLAKYFVILTLLTLPVDQWTKSYSETHFLIHEDESDTTVYQGRRLELIGAESSSSGLTLQLTYVRNHGASWGLLKELPGVLRVYVLVILGISFSVGLLWVAYGLMSSGSSVASLSLLGLIVGSLGNLIDRIRLGYVIDLFSLRFATSSDCFFLPAFNVADITIVLSLIFLIAISFKKRRNVFP